MPGEAKAREPTPPRVNSAARKQVTAPGGSKESFTTPPSQRYF